MTDGNNKEVDARIRAGLSAGDPAALELIWDAYANGLLAFLLSLLAARPDAEDALQTVFVRIARNRESVGGALNLQAYLFGMARNEAMTFLKRRGKRETPVPHIESWLAAVPESGSDPGRAETVAAALEKLPEEQRTVIVMHVFAENTFQEIAGQLAISANTAASRYRYGVAKLRELLKEERG